jgi:hypothetical protein
MDEFGNILNNATTEANQTYASNTASANAAQAQANTQLSSANAEGQSADQNAAKLSALGDQYSNMGNVTGMYNQDEQSQLSQMGFDPTTLNQANQNIAQETGQLGAANNQMASEGGTRGFNAVGAETRQADVQNQANNAIKANTTVQTNELGQANAASTYTGQEIGAQQTSQTNAIAAYNDAATQNNNTMANYAQTLSTMATQATTYGGLVGTNVANIMAGANSAAQAALAKYTAHLDVAQANAANAQAGLYSAQTGLTQAQTTGQNIQNTYNKQMEPLQIAAEKQVTANNNSINTQINALTADINNEKSSETNNNSGSGFAHVILDVINPGNIIGSVDPFENSSTKSTIASQQSQIQQLNSEKSANISS